MSITFIGICEAEVCKIQFMHNLRMQKILSLLLLLLVAANILDLQDPVLAADSVATVIINQVRGDECCLPGSRDFITTLLETESVKDLPLAWALRYDALVNDNFSAEIKKIPKQ